MNANTPTVDLRSLLANQIFLRFSDAELERDFWEFQHTSRLFWVRATIFLAAILVVAPAAQFNPFLVDLLPEPAVERDLNIRLFILSPLLLVAWLASLVSANVRLIRFVFFVATGSVGLAFSSMMYAAGGDSVVFYTYSFIHVLLFMFVMLLQPFRLVFAFAFGLSVFHVVAGFAGAASTAMDELSFHLPTVFSVFFVLAYGAYFMEMATRLAYVANIALNREYTERLRRQEQRSSWLRQFTDFLRHEMKNSMLGISSSLALVERKNKDTELRDYVQRALRGIQFMRRMLEEASQATSLESALSRIEREDVSLTDLLRRRMIEYREMYPDYTFDEALESEFYISCDADKIVQALDKLINNAVEHANNDYPIRVSLSSERGKVVLKVADIGDALGESAEKIFEPFVSRKSADADGNFGLGLYVVKRIAVAHEGDAYARGLTDPSGAEFTVELPLSRAPSGNPVVAQS